MQHQSQRHTVATPPSTAPNPAGFLPGSLWRMHLLTGERRWRDAATALLPSLEPVKDYSGVRISQTHERSVKCADRCVSAPPAGGTPLHCDTRTGTAARAASSPPPRRCALRPHTTPLLLPRCEIPVPPPLPLPRQSHDVGFITTSSFGLALEAAPLPPAATARRYQAVLRRAAASLAKRCVRRRHEARGPAATPPGGLLGCEKLPTALRCGRPACRRGASAAAAYGL
jgi:hypothetical protein